MLARIMLARIMLARIMLVFIMLARIMLARIMPDFVLLQIICNNIPHLQQKSSDFNHVAMWNYVFMALISFHSDALVGIPGR